MKKRLFIAYSLSILIFGIFCIGAYLVELDKNAKESSKFNNYASTFTNNLYNSLERNLKLIHEISDEMKTDIPMDKRFFENVLAETVQNGSQSRIQTLFYYEFKDNSLINVFNNNIEKELKIHEYINTHRDILTRNAMLNSASTLLFEAMPDSYYIYSPIYNSSVNYLQPNERLTRLKGYLITSFNYSDTFNSLAADMIIKGITKVRLEDISSQIDIPIATYTSPKKPTEALELQRSFIDNDKQIKVAITFDVASNEPFYDRYSGPLIIIVGFILSFLIGLTGRSLIMAESKALEMAEYANEELNKFRLAIDNAHDHVVITDPNGLILYANKAVERITGFKIDEILNKKAGSPELWGGLMPRSVYENLWNTISVKKIPFVGELINKRKNGEKYFALVTISPVIDRFRNVKYFVGIERDVTKEKESERLKDELKGFFDLSVDMICVLSEFDYIIQKVNKSFTEQTGWTQEDLVGKPLTDYIFKPDLTNGTYALSNISGVEKLSNIKIRFNTKNKKVVILNWNFIAVGGGKIYGISRDVTKESEVDKMKTEFISLVSHQLKTPLSSIKWYIEMLLEGDYGEIKPEQKEPLKDLFDSNQRMIDLVNSLLNISRIESGRIIVDPVSTNISKLIEGVKKDLHERLVNKQMELDVQIDPEIQEINLDPKLISNVYTNLISNAVKYSKNNSKIRVSVTTDKQYIISTISDSGIGIPDIEQDRIFAKFYRASNAIRQDTDGNGLGLYLVKSIVESSGGKITLESKQDKGTSVTFTLPLAGMKPKVGVVSLS